MNTQIKLLEFNFSQFTKSILHFLETQVSSDIHPSWAIVWKVVNDKKIYYGSEDGRANFLEQLQEGKQLFFPFSSSCIEELHLANGNSYECEDDSISDLLSDIDSLGFLISLNNDLLTIEKAIHYGGCFPHPNNIEVIESSPFDKEMDVFLSAFELS